MTKMIDLASDLLQQMIDQSKLMNDGLTEGPRSTPLQQHTMLSMQQFTANQEKSKPVRVYYANLDGKEKHLTM